MPILPTAYTSDKLHDKHGIQKNVYTAYDVKFDVIKPNNTRKITFPQYLNVVQHMFIDLFSISMFRTEIDIKFSFFVVE